MFADINVCEFVILKVFALLKFAILGLPKVNFVFPLTLMTSSLNFPNFYLVCLFKFGKLSTMKHTASVFLISIQ